MKNGSISYTIFVPTNYNDGQEIEPARLRKVMDLLAHSFGGLTWYLAGNGIWVSDGRVYRDTIVPLVVSVEANPETEKQLIELAIQMRHLLLQEEIFIVGEEVELVRVNHALKVA